jgi:radical SAM superfamily enzyme YgiQ (UPF0313 family)
VAPTNCNVLLVFPRFNPNSFWSFKGACEVWGARCPAPPLGLITLAGLLPSPWNLRLVDRNAEELTDSDLDWADLVMTGGMLPQQLDTLALIELCRARGKPVAVGGPDPTSSPHVYEKADFRVLGEAEGIIDQFIEEWTRGGTKGIFEAKKFTADVTRSPIPRFDLLNLEHYLYVGVQFSRGCPFNCEFCDIIELYGRIPRTKTNEQMLTELDTLYRMGYRGHVDFVDDNLIGNKKALKRFLPVLQEWQKERGYPFKFSTEASINLSDDVELLRMLRDANFFAVFVGIESPDTDTLVSAQKKQNTRRSLAESVHKIYGAGMFVLAGFIVGFDTEKDRVADGMVDCIMATGVPVAMVGLLTALPNTQLSRRLKSEGRLHSDFDVIGERHGDQCTGGLNFVTQRPRRDILMDYRTILEKIYDPAVFFERVLSVGLALEIPNLPVKILPKVIMHELTSLARLTWRVTVRMPKIRSHFWRTFFACALRNPRALDFVGIMTAFYLHLGTFSQHVIDELDSRLRMIDAGEWKEPGPLPGVPPAKALARGPRETIQDMRPPLAPVSATGS